MSAVRGMFIALGALVLTQAAFADDGGCQSRAFLGGSGTEVGNGIARQEKVSLPLADAESLLVQGPPDEVKLVVSAKHEQAWVVEEKADGSRLTSSPFQSRSTLDRLVAAAAVGEKRVETLPAGACKGF